MKHGKWNYTEDITYKVIVVKILTVDNPPMHWQNAFVDQFRQVVEVHHNDHVFHIDNQDGSGLLKISKGGGPDSSSRHLGAFEIIQELSEGYWQQFDIRLYDMWEKEIEEWQKRNHPEQFKHVQYLRSMAVKVRSGDFHIDAKGVIQPGKKK